MLGLTNVSCMLCLIACENENNVVGIACHNELVEIASGSRKNASESRKHLNQNGYRRGFWESSLFLFASGLGVLIIIRN